MGILAWLLGRNGKSGTVRDWTLAGEIKLPHPVKTPLGGSVKNITCTVDLHYRVRAGRIKITKIRLGRSSIGGATFNVAATRRGEAWKADARLRNLLEGRVLPAAIDDLIAKDARLRRAILGDVPATEKQRTFARKLGVRFDEGTGKKDLSELITAALAKRRR